MSIQEQVTVSLAARRAHLKPYQLAEYKAARNWLSRYRPVDGSNLAQVTGYLEAFYHLCRVEDWENAVAIAFMREPTIDDRELHERLFVWGHYPQQRQLYDALLHNVDGAVDWVCLKGLGDVEDVRGNFDRAIEHHQQALALGQIAESSETVGAALGSLGNAYLSKGQPERAIEYYQRQLALAEAAGRQHSIGIALGGLGNAYREIENYQQAAEAAQRRIKVAQAIGDRQGEGDGYCNLGSTYTLLGQSTEAVTVLRQAVKIAQSVEHRLGECRAYGNLGIAYRALSDNGQAIQCFEWALILATTLEDTEGQRLAVLQLGELYQRRGDLPQAIRHQRRALALVSDPLKVATLLLNLGSSSRTLGNLAAAVEFYRDLVTTAGLLDESSDEKRLLQTMGLYCLALVYRQQGETMNAWQSCRAALELSDESVAPLIDQCLDLQKILAAELQTK
ncbi:MAG: tetratricopeptide repeat protein [Cyanobacteria bacterium J06629_9]